MNAPIGEPTAPWFRIVAGNPTPEELAAITVVLAAQSSTAAEPHPTPTNGWSAYWRAVRAPLVPGPSAWRTSGRL